MRLLARPTSCSAVSHPTRPTPKVGYQGQAQFLLVQGKGYMCDDQAYTSDIDECLPGIPPTIRAQLMAVLHVCVTRWSLTLSLEA